MTFWWGSLVLAVAVAVAVAGVSAQDYRDSMEADLSGDMDQGDTEIMQTGPAYGGNGRRGCSTFCACTGSLRSSYCCPSSISMCGSVPVVRRPTEIYSGRTVCRGTLCYRRGRRIVRPADDVCTSRMCDVLRPAHVSQPLGHTCTSHVDCGDNVCCGHRCATVEDCISSRSPGTYHAAQAPPSSMTTSARRCAADVNCNRYGTGHHICCNGQCRSPSACNPAGVYGLHDLY